MNTAVSHSYEYGRTVCIRGHAIYEVFSRLLSALTQIRICTSMRPRILFVWDVGWKFGGIIGIFCRKVLIGTQVLFYDILPGPQVRELSVRLLVPVSNSCFHINLHIQ